MKGAALGVMGEDGDGEYYSGTHPAILRDQVTTTPGGCTMAGLMTLGEEDARGSIAKCIRTTVVASQLGNGVKNMKGC